MSKITEDEYTDLSNLSTIIALEAVIRNWLPDNDTDDMKINLIQNSLREQRKRLFRKTEDLT